MTEVYDYMTKRELRRELELRDAQIADLKTENEELEHGLLECHERYHEREE